MLFVPYSGLLFSVGNQIGVTSSNVSQCAVCIIVETRHIKSSTEVSVSFAEQSAPVGWEGGSTVQNNRAGMMKTEEEDKEWWWSKMNVKQRFSTATVSYISNLKPIKWLIISVQAIAVNVYKRLLSAVNDLHKRRNFNIEFFARKRLIVHYSRSWCWWIFFLLSSVFQTRMKTAEK